MKLAAIFHRMLRMCPLAWYISKRTLQLCCFLLFCTMILLWEWGGSMYMHYELYQTAMSLNETAQAVLLIGILLPVLIEDLHS